MSILFRLEISMCRKEKWDGGGEGQNIRMFGSQSIRVLECRLTPPGSDQPRRPNNTRPPVTENIQFCLSCPSVLHTYLCGQIFGGSCGVVPLNTQVCSLPIYIDTCYSNHTSSQIGVSLWRSYHFAPTRSNILNLES